MSRVKPPSCIGRPPSSVHLKITGRHSLYRTAFLFSKTPSGPAQGANDSQSRTPMAITVTDPWTVCLGNTTIHLIENASSVAVIFPLSRLMFSAQYARFCKMAAISGAVLPDGDCPAHRKRRAQRALGAGLRL